jgi:Rod binding domain-containing protein
MIDNISSSPTCLPPGSGLTPSLTQTNDPAKIRAAARQFEALLISEVLKASREAGGNGWLGTDDEDAGQTGVEMGEQQLASMLASSGGLGLSGMIEAGLRTESAKSAKGAALNVP